MTSGVLGDSYHLYLKLLRRAVIFLPFLFFSAEKCYVNFSKRNEMLSLIHGLFEKPWLVVGFFSHLEVVRCDMVIIGQAV
jgi:hypothetical protein